MGPPQNPGLGEGFGELAVTSVWVLPGMCHINLV